MVDLLSKKETYTARLERGGFVFFYVSIAAFFLILASLGGLIILNRAQREAKQNLIDEVNLKKDNLRTDLINQIFFLSERLKNLKVLLTDHLFISNVLKLIESDTLSNVRFLNFNFDAASRKLDMSGEAESYSTLAKQIGVFERDPQIEHVEFGGLSITTNNFAGFRITILFKNTILHLRP